MVMVSSPPRTSLTTSRTIRWRSVTLSVSAALRRRGRNAVSLRQSQEGCPIVGLVRDRLQPSTKGLFTLEQRGHALAQLLDRQEGFLGGVEKAVPAFAHMTP